MLGIEAVITKKVRKELSPEAYAKVANIMWAAMENGGVYDSKGDLYLVLLAGKKSEVEAIDYTHIRDN